MLPSVRLSVSELECSLGQRVLFSDLSFAMQSGGALALCGRNGSGKSCLLQCLAGGVANSRARVRWNGQTIDLSRDLPEHVVRIGHCAPFDSALNVRDNLRFWAAMFSTPSSELKPLLKSMRQLFDLSPFWLSPICRLSAGEQQRAALSLLLVKPSAALWLLDEPAATLDAAAEKILFQVIEQHRARGGMAIIATHDPLPLTACRRIVLDKA